MSSRSPLHELSAAGVSIWLDDLDRDRLSSGSLAALIESHAVSGVTTNPTIFASALAKGEAYDAQVSELAAAGATVADAVVQITTRDVADGCDVLRGVFDATAGEDGRVSIEVEPGLAHDAAGTIEQGQQLWDAVARPNVMIKVPATKAGLEAITELTARGISVNVTLIFSLARHREVVNAYLLGLERARAAGLNLSEIRSVASFFVSRVDTEIDRRLDELGSPEAMAMKGKAGVANARLAYQVFEQEFASERATSLLASGAHAQRPLWASTGVKDPALRDTLYVEELVAPLVVNTMPQKTMEAVSDHGIIRADTITGNYGEAQGVLDAIAALGIDYTEVTELLEAEGVDKFNASWGDLLDTIAAALATAKEA